jgi:YD repeat-containing protein
MGGGRSRCPQDQARTGYIVTGAQIVQVSHDPPHYERRLVDGTVEVYELADRAASLPARRIFLTELIDPQGHTITYSYDSSFRLTAVTDALGQVTTFATRMATIRTC